MNRFHTGNATGLPMTNIASIIGDCALNNNAINSKNSGSSETLSRSPSLVTQARQGDQQATAQFITLATALQKTAASFSAKPGNLHTARAIDDGHHRDPAEPKAAE